MRDVILARVDGGVRTANLLGDNFDTALPLPILGTPVPVLRGWVSADVAVRGSGWFRFVNTHLEAFDRLAYGLLLAAGMQSWTTGADGSCCLESSLLAVGAGGSVDDFDHQVDHGMTRDPHVVSLERTWVTGLEPVNGFWSSDHAPGSPAPSASAGSHRRFVG